MPNYIVETTDLLKRYKEQPVVNAINMKVKEGEVYGFLGPNGAGKTTTIRMLLGLIRPTSGEVKIFGQDFRSYRMEILSRVGSLVETPTYYGHLTGYENLEAARRLLRVEEKERVDEVLRLVRLEKAKDKKVKDYSLGMKQRLGIATALLNRPKLLILDEPTNGLDPADIQEIRELIKEMPSQFGMTVVVSSHLLSEIDQIAAQVGIIHHGEMIFQDSIDVLRGQSHPRLKISVKEQEEAKAFLAREGFEVLTEQDDPSLYLTNPSQELAGKVNALLVNKGFFVYGLMEVKRSLEEIFIALTGKEKSL